MLSLMLPNNKSKLQSLSIALSPPTKHCCGLQYFTIGNLVLRVLNKVIKIIINNEINLYTVPKMQKALDPVASNVPREVT